MKQPYTLIPAVLALLLLLAACSEEQPWEESRKEAASLTLSLGLPAVSLDTRGPVENPSDPTGWTEWQKVVDGRHLYRVAVFLVDANGEVKACKDVQPGSSDTKNTIAADSLTATVTFGSLEYGSYKLVAVANYSGYDSYTGLSGITDYAASQALYDALKDYNLTTGDDRVCAQVPQPLTLQKDVELSPGMNYIGGELVRTYARIRIEVRNQSATNDLTVNGLTFSNNFASASVPLLGGTGTERGAITVTSANALQAFTAGTTIPKISTATSTSENTTTTTTTVNSAVLFDGYILESSSVDDDADYTYTLDLSYGDTSASTYTVGSTTAITSVNDLTDDGCYLIYNSNSGRYLMAGTNTVSVGAGVTLQQGAEVGSAYVWQLEQCGTNQYYLKYTNDQGTSYYIDNPSDSDIPLVSEESAYFTFSYNSNYYGGSGIQMQSSETTTVTGSGWPWGGSSTKDVNYYIAVSDNKARGAENTGSSTRFQFYPVTGGGSLTKQEEIVLKTINPETAKVEAVREIKRNDFITVLVTVSYNEQSGSFEFDVEPWNTGGGDIEFN